jgi:hypothetical protein
VTVPVLDVCATAKLTPNDKIKQKLRTQMAERGCAELFRLIENLLLDVAERPITWGMAVGLGKANVSDIVITSGLAVRMCKLGACGVSELTSP